MGTARAVSERIVGSVISAGIWRSLEARRGWSRSVASESVWWWWVSAFIGSDITTCWSREELQLCFCLFPPEETRNKTGPPPMETIEDKDETVTTATTTTTHQQHRWRRRSDEEDVLEEVEEVFLKILFLSTHSFLLYRFLFCSRSKQWRGGGSGGGGGEERGRLIDGWRRKQTKKRRWDIRMQIQHRRFSNV